MLRPTERSQEPVLPILNQDTKRKTSPRETFPALRVPRTLERRARQKQEIEALFPVTTNLRGLIANIKSEHSKVFAKVMGSTDFPQSRLAGLYGDLERLVEQIEAKQITDIAEITDYVRNARNIHEVFEDLVIRCAQNSL